MTPAEDENNKSLKPIGATLSVNLSEFLIYSVCRTAQGNRASDDYDRQAAWRYLAIDIKNNKPYRIIIRLSQFDEIKSRDDFPIAFSAYELGTGRKQAAQIVFASGLVLRGMPTFTGFWNTREATVSPATLEDLNDLKMDTYERQHNQDMLEHQATSIKWHTISSASRFCNVDERTIRNWAKAVTEANLPFFPNMRKEGRKIRIPEHDLIPWRKESKRAYRQKPSKRKSTKTIKPSSRNR